MELRRSDYWGKARTKRYAILKAKKARSRESPALLHQVRRRQVESVDLIKVIVGEYLL